MLANKEYKESGVVWLGKLPAHWDVTNYRRLFCRRKEYDDNPDKQVLSLTIEGVKRKNENFGKMAEDFTGHQIVRKDDLVFTPRDFDATPILSGIAPCDGCISNLYFVLYPRTLDIDVNFYNYFMWGVKWGGDIWKKLSYGMRFSYNYDQFCALPAIKIPIEEQKAIATYLDKECARIDGIVTTQRQIIERLKEYKKSVITEAVTRGLNPDAPMKDSGIEWIGDIPVSWDTIKLKFYGKIYNGSTPKSDNPEYYDGDITWVTPADMDNASTIINSKKTITEAGLESCGTNLVPKNSIVISTRAPIGVVCIAGKELCTNQGCKSIVPKDISCVKYPYYFLLTQSDTLNMLGKGTTFLELSTSDLSNYKIPFPAKKEQQTIADYLDRECARIDTIIEKRERMIELMTEYKKSLIYECVTGKKEIVDVVE